jgi:L-threonylcarbamoyladenylate synthase
MCYRLWQMTSSNEISKAAEMLRGGGLVAFPTETVYGLGADATSDTAVAKVYAAKGRPMFNPLIVHVASLEEAKALGEFDELSESLARIFWPGSLTLVVLRKIASPISMLASAGLDTIALRVPKHEVALALLSAAGLPVVAPSANPSGRISPTTAQHVRDGLGIKVDAVLDGGACVVGVESTVVRMIEDGPYLLRAGGIARGEIENVLGQTLKIPTPGDGELHSPGQLESHYAPHARLRLNATAPVGGEVFIGFGAHAHGPFSLSARGDVVEAAANLFRVLHEVDALRPPGIAVAPVPMHGLGEAINDRLKRAAAGR